MSKLRSAEILLLTVAVLGLTLGGCQLFGGAPDDPMQELRQQVRDTVTDAERQALLLASIDQMDNRLEDLAGEQEG